MSSSDLSQSIGNASSAMAVGNVTYEETLGLLTAGTEITRNSNKVSRALVSVQSRYNQILDDSSSTGQKLIAFYKDHGIAIKDEKGNPITAEENIEIPESLKTITEKVLNGEEGFSEFVDENGNKEFHYLVQKG